MMTKLQNKEFKLEMLLKEMETVVIAFSGGVDSSLVLKKAIDVLGTNNVKAVIVKSELFRNEEFNYVLDGMIMDDISDFRPGLKARSEYGVRSVLQEVELYKDEVRELSKSNGLTVWDKPALCSLASRIPYGEPLSFNKVNKVNEAEKFILDLDINNVRVRYHDNIARIEVDETDIVTMIQHKDQISLRLKELGFDYVTIDLEGYRTGSMNEVIQS